MRSAVCVIMLLVLSLSFAGCARKPASSFDPGPFLKEHGLEVEGEPERLSVQVPAKWEVPLGAYPEGLYWGLANEYSKDAGLDLTGLKGKHVDVWRYAVAGGLPGEGEQSRFQYPSDLVLLVREEKVVGAWFAFNKHGLGPSIKRRNLQQITGLSVVDWAAREKYFTDAGPNADLAKLGPAEVLAAFLEAVTSGDKRRAHACLSPAQLINDLTVNLEPGRLYNSGFSKNNSMAENIVRGRLIGYKYVDPDLPANPVQEVGNRTRIEIVAQVEIFWRDAAFNTPDGKTTRFAIMEKGPWGWKLNGLGTGP